MTNAHPPKPRPARSVQRGETSPARAAADDADADANIVVPRALLDRVVDLLKKDYERLARREIKQALDTLRHGMKHQR